MIFFLFETEWIGTRKKCFEQLANGKYKMWHENRIYWLADWLTDWRNGICILCITCRHFILFRQSNSTVRFFCISQQSNYHVDFGNWISLASSFFDWVKSMSIKIGIVNSLNDSNLIRTWIEKLKNMVQKCTFSAFSIITRNFWKIDPFQVARFVDK